MSGDAALHDPVVGLVFTIMEHNAREAAWVQNAIQTTSDRVIREQAESFCDFYDAVYEIPDMVRSSYLDGLLHEFWYDRHSAGDRCGRQMPGGGLA